MADIPGNVQNYSEICNLMYFAVYFNLRRPIFVCFPDVRLLRGYRVSLHECIMFDGIRQIPYKESLSHNALQNNNGGRS